MLLLFQGCDGPDSGDDSALPANDVVTLAAGGLDHPVDAAPVADGSRFYFLNDGEGAGLWTVPADGSSAPVQLAPFAGGRSVVVSRDDAAAYVSVEDDAGERVIVEVHLDGSGTEVLAESAGLSPGGLADLPPLERPSHNCLLFFTGRAAGVAETLGVVYAWPPGDSPAVLAQGFDGGLPEALDAAADRTVWVSVVDLDGTGSLWRIPPEVVDGGGDPATAAVRVAGGWRPGEVPGIATTLDGATVLVSSLSEAGTSQVVLVDAASGATSIFDDVIRENTASGGVHRARDTNVFAWADSESSGRGGVYRVGL